MNEARRVMEGSVGLRNGTAVVVRPGRLGIVPSRFGSARQSGLGTACPVGERRSEARQPWQRMAMLGASCSGQVGWGQAVRGMAVEGLS